ncbi:hypothetical protein ACI65C_004939 [Semiaphis heraclei]
MMTYTRHVLEFGQTSERLRRRRKNEKNKSKNYKETYASCYTNPFHADNADWSTGLVAALPVVVACVRACLYACEPSVRILGSLRVEEVEAVAADVDDEETVVVVVMVVVVVVVVVVTASVEERDTSSSAGDQTVQQQQSRSSYRSWSVTSAPLLCKVYSPRVVVVIHLLTIRRRARDTDRLKPIMTYTIVMFSDVQEQD